ADTSRRSLCVSLVGRVPDSAAMIVLRRSRNNVVPINRCPPTTASFVAPLKPRPPGPPDPVTLTIGRATFWTRDIAVVSVTIGYGRGGTSYVCEVLGVGGAPGGQVERCREYRRWLT